MKFDVNTNGNGHHAGVAQAPAGVDRDMKTDESDPLLDPEEDAHALEDMPGAQAKGVGKGRVRKATFGVVVMLLLVAVAVTAAWLTFGGPKRKATVRVRPGDGVTDQRNSPSDMTDTAIAEATRDLTSNGTQTGAANSNQASPATTPQVSSSPVTQSAPDYSGTVLANEATTNANANTRAPETTARTDSPSTSTATQTTVQTGNGQQQTGRNRERSVRFGIVAPPSVSNPEARPRPEAPPARERDTTVNREQGARLPPFGSMLPVRSLGVLYTLRPGGLARFELTRDLSGRGWEMRKGTVLVGALRGAEYDRAYVAIVGFIDPETDRFVRVTGDLLGGDGASGIKGKRRRMSGGWSRVLGRLGEAGLNIAGNLASSASRRPIIITDAYGSYGSRVTNEMQGVLSRDNRREFVEVAAGSTGYVLITNLPEQIEGASALSQLSSADLRSRADVTEPRQLTGISESELAELIERGRPDEIRAAMPRMTPEMRRIAQAVLDEAGE